MTDVQKVVGALVLAAAGTVGLVEILSDKSLPLAKPLSYVCYPKGLPVPCAKP